MTTVRRKDLQAGLEAKRRDLIRTIRGCAAQLTLSTGEAEPIDRIQGMVDRDEAAIMLSQLSLTGAARKTFGYSHVHELRLS